MTASREFSERLLVLMPTRKDTERTIASLGASGISCVPCADLEHLCREISGGAGAALLPEEAIMTDRSGCLKGTLASEPAWSGFPLIVLTRQGSTRISLPNDLPINVTLVERPVRMVTLKSVVDTALRHRRRQYQLRAVLRDLEKAKEELEVRVNERTARLQETIAELEAFSYSVSHDLRAPLRAMQGYADALLEEEKDGLSERGKQFLGRIHRASARLDLLVREVLAYTKVAKGEIRLQPVTVATLFDDVLRGYPEFTEKAAITVDQPLPSVIAHEGYLTQCISNILGNAIKFVAPGVRPAVHVWAEAADNKVRLKFQDNGIGIAPEHRQRIFQLFGRVHSESAFPGTGIGLAVVKKAVERMGGTVGFESEPERGSCFWLELRKA
ncbi:MAG TPA: HAMP domain-containing sensor histidine kinase [Verrucomicrobiae bacterium]|nr:HAMP domain-containing sensor histidine kinase [Verrucomicrobiae bacterium]